MFDIKFQESYWLNTSLAKEPLETLLDAADIVFDLSKKPDIGKVFRDVRELFAFLQFKCLTLKACGFAAPQFGFTEKAFVVFFKGQFYNFYEPEVVHLNPIQQADDTISLEGCMSIPNKVYLVQRRNKITLKPIKGDRPKVFCGQLSRIVQHELDHLNGVYIKDRGLPHYGR